MRFFSIISPNTQPTSSFNAKKDQKVFAFMWNLMETFDKHHWKLLIKSSEMNPSAIDFLLDDFFWKRKQF